MPRTLANLLACCLLLAAAPLSAAEPVDYLRQIKPIFARHCYQCHGPDAHESDLRLDTARAALEGGINGAAIEPGQPDDSLLLQAISGTADFVSRMPPEDKSPPLADDQIALIRRWIAEGAKHPDDEAPAAAGRRGVAHWSFQPLRQPPPPEVLDRAWTRNAIDHFILARLETAAIAPSAEADRVTLIRRLSFDLTGLPPTLEEVAAFLADDAPDAYERLVERLLASPQYGERFARHWLDLARYADSNGYTNDNPRTIWAYRDWVIDAINRDLPFDQFTIEQFAGDLLPRATQQQMVATGFHRNTQINDEGGSDAEQYRVEAVIDRVATTGDVFLGLSLGCARCHEHKYDPISQAEFYQFYAFLNDQDEPNLTVTLDTATRAAWDDAQRQLAAAQQTLAEYDEAAAERQAAWERTLQQTLAPGRAVTWSVLRPVEMHAEKGAKLSLLDDGSVLVEAPPATDVWRLAFESPLGSVAAIRLEALTHPSLPKRGPGWASNGNFVLHEVGLAAISPDRSKTPLAWSAATADHSQPSYPIEHAIDGKPTTGWAINVAAGQGSMNVDRAAVFTLAEPWAGEADTRLELTLEHHQNSYLLGRFRVSATDADRATLAAQRSPALVAAVQTPPAERSPQQRDLLAAEFRQNDTQRGRLEQAVAQAKEREQQLAKEASTTTLVLRERSQPRESYIHVRGEFLRKGKAVEPATPAVLPPLAVADDRRPNRLDLARWLVADDNPLTPRVTANRAWLHLFGRGLVETENDFGLAGSPPTHPELLDWLAAELVASGWDLKHLHRTIVASAVYRQASRGRTDLIEVDPDNYLLARQNRLRLEAEAIRDNTLAASGLLSYKLKGPSVFPPQPAGVMQMTRNPGRQWKTSTGDDRYRRGLYTHFWRSTPHPFLKTFNAPEANTACTRRDRSNTPLQALTLLNDEAFIEAAQALAVRVWRERTSADDDQRLAYAFELCVGRRPATAEQAALARLLAAERADPRQVERQTRFAPAAWAPPALSPHELAAWTSVARTLMNLDEFMTRE